MSFLKDIVLLKRHPQSKSSYHPLVPVQKMIPDELPIYSLHASLLPRKLQKNTYGACCC